GIPIVFLTTGLHEDYHVPSDEVGKLNFEKMRRVTEFVSGLAREIAHRPQRVRLDKPVHAIDAPLRLEGAAILVASGLLQARRGQLTPLPREEAEAATRTGGRLKPVRSVSTREGRLPVVDSRPFLVVPSSSTEPPRSLPGRRRRGFRA